ncbi:hypothetical protein [Azohydromonas aeria]|uniref:hypothetical protein n=1 Tax=Azohydromonas aeria TaxID=2590212 RepID=UPI0012F9B047|nr:hypothetical protein [Azohydromonas aeria]
MKAARVLLIPALLAIGGVILWQQVGKTRSSNQASETLDPARVILIRTPGGQLQVSEMRKAEEVTWRTSWECPIADCSRLPRTESRVKVTAHYVYRIPLAAEWKLQLDGDHYKLTLPAPQLQTPVAFDTATMEILTTEKSLFSPAAAPNREKAVRHLGPELAQRGRSTAYLDMQKRSAEQTVQEFASQWMLEQGSQPQRPIRVEFRESSPL